MDVFLANAGVKHRNKHSRLSPPLGLAYIAAVLKKHGYSVAAQDFNLSAADPAQIGAILSAWSPRLVGISVSTETYPNGLELARIAKEIDPTTTVVLGGPHATVMYREILRERNVDIVVRGEGEYAMLEIADCFLRSGRELATIKGIAYRRDSYVHATPERLFIADPDELPFPARQAFPMPLYEQPGQVLLSRGGCPFRCCFCGVNNIWKGRRRFRRTEQVVREILDIYAGLDCEEISFADDTFTLNRKRVLALCEASEKIQESVPWRWGCTTRVDLVDRELVTRMAAAGCYAITFGVETGSQEVMDAITKKITLEQVKQSVGMALEARLAVLCSFMFPHPQDTVETIREQKAFMKSLVDMGAQVSLAFTTPFPGTSYFKHREELGIRLLTTRWEEFDAKHLIIETRNLSHAVLEDLFQELAAEVGLRHD